MGPSSSSCPSRDPVLTYLQAVVLGLVQGVTELFPVSSLGHSVIVPQLLGWTDVVAAQSASESYFLAFLVGLHVATALALLFFYRDIWGRIVVAVFGSLRTRRIDTPDARLGWLLVVATIPAGLAGVLFEHLLRVLFAVPLAAAGFLIVNGLILLAGEVVRRRAAVRTVARIQARQPAGDRRLETLEFREAGLIGVAQVFALLAGISRSGITMVAGLVAGPRSRGCGPLLVPAGDPDHPGRGSLQAARSARPEWRRRAGPDPRRERRGRPGRVRLGALPEPLLHDPDAAAVRGLLPHRGRAGGGAVRLMTPGALDLTRARLLADDGPDEAQEEERSGQQADQRQAALRRRRRAVEGRLPRLGDGREHEHRARPEQQQDEEEDPAVGAGQALDPARVALAGGQDRAPDEEHRDAGDDDARDEGGRHEDRVRDPVGRTGWDLRHECADQAGQHGHDQDGDEQAADRAQHGRESSKARGRRVGLRGGKDVADSRGEDVWLARTLSSAPGRTRTGDLRVAAGARAAQDDAAGIR